MSLYPEMFSIRQQFAGPAIKDVAGAVDAELRKLQLSRHIQPADRVAITAGSRGIANIPIVLRAIVDHVKRLGGEPFVVTAMGSHGGATSDGQRGVLSSLGVTEQSVGCEIRATMDTVLVCQSREGVDIHFDRHAYEADHVIVCNRVKLHTDFTERFQSGLMKMMLIGLGNHTGASNYHRAFREYSFDQIVQSVSATVVKECGVIGCLGIVENGYEQTSLIQAVEPNSIATAELELLEKSKQWMARLPFESVDLLIVDEIGKNISGTGMDTNVVGRKVDENRATAGETPRIAKIFVRDLTEQTHGNATGIGVADFTTKRVIDKMDYPAMRVNCVTSGRTAVGMIPIYYSTEKEVIDAALTTCGLAKPNEVRVAWIRNTLDLENLLCSGSMLAELGEISNVDIISEGKRIEFDRDGNLLTPWQVS